MEPKKYRSIPTVVEAMRFTEEDAPDVVAWANGKVDYTEPADREDDAIGGVFDDLHSSWISVYPGQWIIKGTKGEFYPCDPEVFAQKYEEVQ